MRSSTATVPSTSVSLIYVCSDTFKIARKFARNEMVCPIQNFSGLFVLLYYQQLTVDEFNASMNILGQVNVAHH